MKFVSRPCNDLYILGIVVSHAAKAEKDEIMEALYEYRKPRNALLILVSDYVSICTRRVGELKQTMPPLLDDISIGVSFNMAC